MEESILTGTKKILGLGEDYTAFDLDVITHINAAFSILNQLGVGPSTGFGIEDDEAEWDDFECPIDQLNLVRTYIFLKVRVLFDPPGTSFLLEAANNQIREFEWRLNSLREVASMTEEEVTLLNDLAERNTRLYRELHRSSIDC